MRGAHRTKLYKVIEEHAANNNTKDAIVDAIDENNIIMGNNVDCMSIFDDKHIVAFEKIISEYHLQIGEQRIGIKITIDNFGYYRLALSHYYYNTKTKEPYHTNKDTFDSEFEALTHARYDLLHYYDPKDKDAKWVANEVY